MWSSAEAGAQRPAHPSERAGCLRIRGASWTIVHMGSSSIHIGVSDAPLPAPEALSTLRTMRLPPPLAAGARVALVAPAGPLRGPDDLTSSIAQAESLGWE